MSLESKILAWAKSSAGKQRISNAMDAQLSSGKDFGGLSTAKLEQLGQSLSQAIARAVPPALSSSYQASVNVRYCGHGEISLEIAFDKSRLTRDSLYGYQGVYDIFGLFSKGYTIGANKPHPYGLWHGKPTWALVHRDAAPFVEGAVSTWRQGLGGALSVKEYTVNPLYT